MEAWSDLPVTERFRIKFYLDTNILAYIVDNTYSGLTTMINFLKDSEFSDLISSKYVVFEFVGIRKKEHYLRAVIANSTSAATGQLNLSSLLKYRDDFNATEAPFDTVKAAIEQKVMQELKDILNFSIDYEKNILHESLLAPTFELTLRTKISRHDSIVYMSSAWPDVGTKEDFVFLMSNDLTFVQNTSHADVDGIIQAHGLSKPHVECIRSLQENNAHKINLTLAGDDALLPTFLPFKIKELLIKKNQSLFLGRTIPCGNGQGFPTNVICFSLNANTVLNNNIYLIIIGKDLDFIFSIKVPVVSFWNQTEITVYPFQNAAAINISFKPMDNSTGAPLPLPAAIINRLRESGNLVFINPD